MKHYDIRVRRVQADDASALERMYRDLSDSSRQLRFHSRSRAIDERAAANFAAADHLRSDGFVALEGSRIVGHLVLEPLGSAANEMAVVVDDRMQGSGAGTLLVAAALASARLRAIPWLVAWVMSENRSARHLLESTHHRVRRFWEGPVARYEIEVPPMPQAAGRR